MQKKVIKSIVGPLIGLCFFYCSSLDDYTGLGSDVVKDSDPTLMNFGDNFFSLALDSAGVLASDGGSFSVPNKVEPSGFGKHGGKLAAGNSEDHTLYGIVEFPVTYSFTKIFDSASVFDSIVFVFDTLSDTIHSSSIASGDSLKLFTANSMTAGFKPPPAANSRLLSNLHQAIDSDSAHWVGTLTDTILKDSIFSHCRTPIRTDTLTDSNGKDSTVSDSTLRVYMSLLNSGNNILWFKSDADHLPAMVFHTHYTKHLADNKDTVIYKTDTLRGYPSFVATESAALITENSSRAISSWLSGRIAVFKLDLKPLWDTMQATGFHELLSAGFAVNGNLRLTDNNDTMPPVNYFLADELYMDIDSINNQFSIASKNYSPVFNLKKPGDTTDMVLPIDYPLQHFLDGSQREFYLYIRLASSAVIWNQEVLWSKPRFKAVLTTIN